MKQQTKLKQTEIGEIPEDWEEKKLSELMEIVGGGTPKTTNKSYWGGDICWLSVTDFNNGRRYVYDTEKKITKEGLENSSTKILKKDMLIISARGTVGEIAQLAKDMAFNQSCYGLNAKKESTNDFLFYLIKYHLAKLKNHSYGSVFDTITTKTFDEILIRLPSLKEQQSIAKILSDLDSKIELNQKMNKTFEAIGQALFKHWFIDFEFPNEKGKPYKSSGGDMVDSEIGDIPKGWKVEKAINLFKLEYGWHLPEWDRKEGKIPVYGSGGLSGFHNESFVKGFGIIIGRAGKIGSDSVYYSHKEFCPIETTYYVSIENKLLVRYLYFFIKTMSMVNTGSSVPNLSRNSIHNSEIIIPDFKIIEKFDRVVEKLFDMKYKNEEEIKNLYQIRDSLLPQLMSGKIRVK